MKTILKAFMPVLPSADIQRDILWYKNKTGFELMFADDMYAVLGREGLYLHLQWHADTESDPLLGGSVIRIDVQNIQPLFEEFIARGTVKQSAFKCNTPWNTNEFGFYDLNNNAIFIMEGIN
jgi:hypothetical protein